MLKFRYRDEKGEFMDQKEKSRQTIEYIVKCGIEEFAEKGKLVSLNGICQKYNISKGKLYHHFTSKDELLCDCVCYCLSSLTESIYAFEVDPAVSVLQNFHDYYYQKILMWQANPSHLRALRNAYSLRNVVFSAASMEKIRKFQDAWRESKKVKIFELLNSNNDKMRIDAENVSEVMLLMYENTFQVLEDKMLAAVANGDCERLEKISDELMEYHDSIINMILYGAIEAY